MGSPLKEEIVKLELGKRFFFPITQTHPLIEKFCSNQGVTQSVLVISEPLL